MKLNIGENIKCLRREKDITQEQLAEMLGVSYQSVSRWETGACYPDMELLPTLANIFETTVDKLLGVNEQLEQEKAQTEIDLEKARRANLVAEEEAKVYQESEEAYHLKRLELLKDMLDESDKVYFIPEGADITLFLGNEPGVVPVE